LWGSTSGKVWSENGLRRFVRGGVSSIRRRGGGSFGFDVARFRLAGARLGFGESRIGIKIKIRIKIRIKIKIRIRITSGRRIRGAGAVGGGEDVGGELAHGGVGAFEVVGFALKGVEPAFEDAPGVVAGRDFAGGLGFVAKGPELGLHDGAALALVGLFGGDVGLVFEFAEQLDGAESRLEPLDAGGELAGGSGRGDRGQGTGDRRRRGRGGDLERGRGRGFGMDGGGGEGALFLVEGLDGLAGDGVEALVLEPAIEAFLLAGGELAFFTRVGFAAPVGDFADDLGDAALGELVLFGELFLGFAGDLVSEKDFLVAGGGGGAFAGLADRDGHGEAPERVRKQVSSSAFHVSS
jgi:hypothetical protein